MDLEQGLAFAAQGRSVLFLGAGFSWGATSLSGDSFLMGPGLSEALAKEAKLPEEFSLEDTADLYLAKLGATALLQKLRSLYTARDVSLSHRILAKLP